MIDNAQLSVTPLPYPTDTAAYAHSLTDLPWLVFLSSGFPHSSQGRYDILTAQPFLTVTYQDQVTSLHYPKQTIRQRGDPFFILRDLLNTYQSINSPLFPFQGGGIGYFSYDLGRCIESLPKSAKLDYDIPDMAMGLYDWAIITDHQQRVCHLIARHHQPETRELIKEVYNRLDKSYTPPPKAPFRLLNPFVSNLTKKDYEHTFQKIHNHIKEGDIYQLNFAQRFKAHASGDPWLAYQQLRQKHPTPFGAYLSTPFATLMSFSPERFLQVKSDLSVETKPIKGTRPRGQNKAHDQALATELLQSGKDRAENLMIVDLLRNDLSKLCQAGSVKVPLLFDIEHYSSVHHLVSTLIAQLPPDQHPLDLLRACFPGGSITGVPKIRAMELIEKFEPTRRHVYCGSIGYIDFNKQMDTNIAIRTLVHTDQQLYCSAGGGIIADSNVTIEHQETLDKINVFLQQLQTHYLE